MDRLFIEFAQDRQSNTPRPLVEWIASNPDMKQDFVAWAADIPAMDYAEGQPADAAAEAHTLHVGMGVLKKLGFTLEESVPFSSLNEAARQQGVSPKQLAQKLGVGVTLFAKLNRRLLNAATIPVRLIERLAEELKISVEQTRAYLSQPPTLAAGAMYRSEQAPEVTEPQDFADAVRVSSDMSDTEKAVWLAGE
jgi:hypothetical protein